MTQYYQELLHMYQELLQLQVLIEQKNKALGMNVKLWFVVEPCSRCHEFTMELLDVSPTGRSIQYKCTHCEKKMRAPAGTPDAPRIVDLKDSFEHSLREYDNKAHKFWQAKGELNKDINKDDKTVGRIEFEAIPASTWGSKYAYVIFESPAAPLPYEQTTRTPIPEAVRSEVWRRDSGRCVQCGSKQNLQFDHIIPVVLGGATSVTNLQILCQSCNLSKGKKI